MSDGGFMSQPVEEKRKRSQKQTLVPSTIKMCMGASKMGEASEDSCEVDGRFTTQVRLVANILSVEPRETRIHYTLEDGTGKIEGTVWTNQQDDELPMLAEKREKCVPGAHVVVVGVLKEFGGTKTIRCYDVRPVDDFNELTHHFLEVIHLHGKSKRAPREPVQQQGDVKQEGSWGGAGSNIGGGQGQQPMEVEANANGLTANQNRIYEYYNQNGQSDEGCHVETVAAAMAPYMNHADVIDCINVLVAEGFLYSTIDEENHKSTDSM